MADAKISDLTAITSLTGAGSYLLELANPGVANFKITVDNFLAGISSTPGGSDTQVQFNNAGSFGGSANFVWDNANTRLGIGTSSPNSLLHVSGAVSVSGQPILLVGANNIASPSSSGTVFGYNHPDANSTNFLTFQNNGSNRVRINGGNTPNIILSQSSGNTITIDPTRIFNTTSNLTISTGAGYSTYIKGAGSTDKPLIVQGSASQTANLQEWQDSAGTVVASINNDGTQLKLGPDASKGIIRYSLNRLSFNSVGATNFFIENNMITVGNWGGTTRINTATAGVGNANRAGNSLEISSGESTGSGAASSIIFKTSPTGSSGTAINALISRMIIGGDGNVLVNGFTASTVGVTVKGAVSQTANLQEWQDSAGTVLASIANNGRLILTQAGSAGSIYLENTSAVYAKNTLGVYYRLISLDPADNYVARNESPGGSAYYGCSNPGNVSGNIFFQTVGLNRQRVHANGTFEFNPNGNLSSTVTPVVIKGSVSQTANLQEWQNSSGTVLASVTPTQLRAPRGSVVAGEAPGLAFTDRGDTGIGVNNQNIAIWESGAIALNLTHTLKEFRVPQNYYYSWSAAINNNAASDTRFSRASAGVIQLGYGAVYNALICGAPNASTKAAIIRGAASQTANLQEWQNSSGTALVSIDPNGRLTLPGNSTAGIYSNAVTDNQLNVQGGAGNIAVVVRGSSGVHALGSGRLGLGSTHRITWHTNTDGLGSGDTGISRNAAGVIEVNNGTAGQYRDLILRNIEVTNTATFTAEFDIGNSGASKTVDWNDGNNQKITLNNNCTLSFTAPPGVGFFSLRVIQDGTGSRTITWPAAAKWSGGTAPTLTTTASAYDVISFYFDGTNYNGAFMGNFS